MGGERQHYIPRFLLKGFASRTSGVKIWVWYIRKDASPKEVSLRDIALEKNFYGKPGEDSLDQTITDKETDFANVVNKVRETLKISDEDLDMMIHFVQDLIIRTRHVRKGFTEGVEKLVNMFSENISDADRVKNLLQNEKFRDQLSKSQIKKLKKNPRMLSQLGKLFSAILHRIDIPNEIEAAHKNAITRVYDEPTTKRIEEYKKLDWTINIYEDNAFILGDVAVIQFNTKTGKFSIPMTVSKNENVIILPISHNKLVVGSVSNDFSFLTPENINSAIAQLSMDFIISSENGRREKDYKQIIGEKAEYIDNSTLENLKRKTFK